MSDKYYERTYTDSTYQKYKSKLKKILNADIIDFTTSIWNDGMMQVIFDKNNKRYCRQVSLKSIRED